MSLSQRTCLGPTKKTLVTSNLSYDPLKGAQVIPDLPNALVEGALVTPDLSPDPQEGVSVKSYTPQGPLEGDPITQDLSHSHHKEPKSADLP